MMDLTQKQWIKHAVMHPFEGFEDMRWKRSGSVKAALFIVVLLFFGYIAHDRLYGFQFYVSYDKTFSVIPYIFRSFIVFTAWVVGNWAVCTLLDGEGTIRNICIYSAYALIPYVAQMYANVLLSHFLIRDEYVFLQIIGIIGTCWTALLLFSAIRSVHNYSVKKTFFAIILTVTAMLIMLFLLVLFMSLVQQVYIFLSSVITELSYRLRA